MLFLLLAAPALGAGPARVVDRYFLSGDGSIRLTNDKSAESAHIRYRLADGTYPEAARRRIDRLFGVPAGSEDHISLRLISLLDYMEDRYHDPIDIISGYRSPEYNEGLRAQGRLAARASLHMEGMAANVKLGKTLAPRAFEGIKALDCCGIGYYHGDSVHVDTGPARFWDETSSKVRTDISTHDKRVMVRTDRDIYLAGERVELKLARITDYPLGLVSRFSVVRDGATLQSYSLDRSSSDCLPVTDPEQRTWVWTIPGEVVAERRVQIRLRFCTKPFPEMPDQIDSNPILILKPG